MLFLLQIALGITFIALLILAIFDAAKGSLIILSGLVLIVAGYTLKLISCLLKKINPPKLVEPVVRKWQGIASENNACRTLSACALDTDSTAKSPQTRPQPHRHYQGRLRRKNPHLARPHE